MATRYAYLLLCILLGLCVAKATSAAEVGQQLPVRAELERMEQAYGFEVRGIEQTDGADGWVESQDPLIRLKGLLEGFDHIILQTSEGQIERVIILGEKVAYVPPPEVATGGGSEETAEDGPLVLPMRSSGSSHMVTAGLEGANGQRIDQALMIDTGAERIVLPASLVARLGLPPDSLRNQQVQTANGIVAARVGRLPAVWLGQRRVADVDVAFIDDQSLGGNALLGMSLLGRYRMTLDDKTGRLTLASKDDGVAAEPASE